MRQGESLVRVSQVLGKHYRTAAYWAGGIRIDIDGNVVLSEGEESVGLDQWIN